MIEAFIPQGRKAFRLAKLMIPTGSVVDTGDGLKYENSVRITVRRKNKSEYYLILPNACPGNMTIPLRKPKLRERIKLWKSGELTI